MSEDAFVRALVFVLPGGSYGAHADNEAEPVAQWLESLGFAARVLRYPVAPHRHPEALDMVRAEIARARVEFPCPIGVIGFSAGGHLAGLVSYSPVDSVASVPDFAVLCYPVTRMGTEGHVESRTNLFGSEFAEAGRYTLAGLVRSDSPPTFLWHTANDEAVSVKDSLELAEALANVDARFALHIFSDGVHGLGLAQHSPAEPWTELCAKWLREVVTAH